jgi:hypothetical protein
MFSRKKQTSEWTSHAAQSKQTPWQRITSAAAPKFSTVKAQLDGLLGTNRRVSDMIVSAGEILAESLQSPAGRVIVAASSLTGAWLLL